MPDDNLTPSTSNDDQSVPSLPTNNIPVPGDIAAAGQDTNEPQADSPETLDQEMSENPEDATVGTDHTLQQSADDTSNGQGDELLPEDHDTPFSDPDDVANDATDDPPVSQRRSDVDDTHQAFDPTSDIQREERYDEGPSGAAEVSEPNAGNTVTDYNPDQDTRRQS
jgi:hypothetical protein